MKKQWFGIILLLVISVSYELLIKELSLNKWGGEGLVLGIVFGTLSALIIYFFLLRYTPKTKEEAKNFEFKGLFNPLFGVIMFGIISIVWTLLAIFGSMHFLYPIIGWLITLIYVFYWISLRKWLIKK